MTGPTRTPTTKKKARECAGYDREECKRQVQANGIEEAMKTFPKEVVRPIARSLGLWKKRPSQVWKPEWDAHLGKRPDEVLAVEFGVSHQTVKKHRQEGGIDAPSRRTWALGKLKAVSDEELVTTTEDDLAQKYDAPIVCIRAERRARGLSKRDSRGDVMRSVVAEMLVLGGKKYGAMADIARKVGVSRERVRQLVAEVEATLVEDKKSA